MNTTMTKKMFLAVLFLVFGLSQNVKAQSIEFEMFKVGYRYGMPKLTLNNSEINTKNSHGGYLYWALEKRFAERFALMMDVGGSYENSTYGRDAAELNVQMAFADFAIGLKFYPMYDLGIYAAAQGGLKLWSKGKMTSQFFPFRVGQSDVNEFVQKQFDKDLGLRFGLDYRIVDDLAIDVFYDWGGVMSRGILKSRGIEYGGKQVGRLENHSINVGIKYVF